MELIRTLKLIEMKANLKIGNGTHFESSKFTYDTPIVCQPAMFLIRVEMCDNIYSIHLGNKCEASNRGLCYMFLIPKIVHPAVLSGIFGQSNRAKLQKQNLNIFVLLKLRKK